NMLMLCGTVGKSGGGWTHYTGQECIRPEVGWATLAFGLDWMRPPRHMAGTDYFYLHSDQWRYETLKPGELLSPLADRRRQSGSMVDCSVRAQHMGWLPSAPQFGKNPLEVAREAAASGDDPKQYIVDALTSGRLNMACEDPDDPANWPTTCSCGAPTCSVPRARATNISSGISSARNAACRARTWAR